MSVFHYGEKQSSGSANVLGTPTWRFGAQKGVGECRLCRFVDASIRKEAITVAKSGTKEKQQQIARARRLYLEPPARLIRNARYLLWEWCYLEYYIPHPLSSLPHSQLSVSACCFVPCLPLLASLCLRVVFFRYMPIYCRVVNEPRANSRIDDRAAPLDLLSV